MKKHVYEGIRRVLSLGLCLCLAAGYVPLPALAEGCGHVHGEGCYTVTTDCVHTHEADCWSDMDLQAAGEEADACGHICSEDTGCVTAVLSCGHVHDGDCGYAVAQAVEEQQPEEQKPEKQEPEEQQPEKQEPGGQEPEGQKSEGQQPGEQEPKQQPQEQPENQDPREPQMKTVTAWTWVDEQEALDPETGKLYLSATQEAPVFYEQIVEVLPQAVEATVDGETETLPIAHWESADYPQETGAYSGSYRFAASLPEGYTLAEDAAALDVTVEFGGAVTLIDPASCAHGTVNETTGICAACNTLVRDASLTTGSTVKAYESITDALTAAEAYGKPCSLKLLRDVEASEFLLAGNVTLDGGGHTAKGCWTGPLGKISNLKMIPSTGAAYSVVATNVEIFGENCEIHGLYNGITNLQYCAQDGCAFFADSSYQNFPDNTLNDYTVLYVRRYNHKMDWTTGKCTDCNLTYALSYTSQNGSIKGYTNLADALKAVGTDGGTIAAYEDFTKSDTEITGSVTIQLNGHTWRMSNGLEISSGNVQIKNGKIYRSSSSKKVLVKVNNGCSLTLDGSMVLEGRRQACDIQVENGGTLILDKGVVILGGVQNKNGKLRELWRPNTAFAEYDSTTKKPKDPLVLCKGSSKSATQDVIVVEHNHIFDSNGKCTLGCAYQCPHTTIDESAGACAQCGKTYEAAVIGSKTTTYYTTFAEAFSSAASAETLKLLRDVTLTSRAEILHSMTLDLNGHDLTQTGDGEPVLLIDGGDLTLILTDSTTDTSKHGKITHAAGTSGAGVQVEWGTLRMTGGVICGNGTLTNKRPYAGVLISNGDGEFYMEGGTIRGNAYPGGVVSWGAAVLSGGTITENNSADGYGGVYNSGHITFGGSINITGNLVNGNACNLYLLPLGDITLEKPTSGFSVGITTADTVGTDGILIAKGSTAKVTKTDFSGIFSDAGLECQAVTEESGEYVLRYYSAHDYTGTTTGQCTRCGAVHDHTGHFVNGICQVCQYACTHGSVKESGGVYTCNACGEEMCVKISDTWDSSRYYADFEQAVTDLNDMKPDAMRQITLLKDAVIRQPVTLQKRGSQYNLNIVLNGKKLTGEPLTITGDIRAVFSAEANSTVEAEVILDDVNEVAFFPKDYNLSFKKITDKTGTIKKEAGTTRWEFSDSAQNWIHWDSIPEGYYTYENVTASCIPAVVSAPLEGTMSYGGSMPESFQSAKMKQNDFFIVSGPSGYTYTVSWWLGQEKLAEKQVGDNVPYGPDDSDSWAGLAAGTYTVTCRMSATKVGARNYEISKQVKLTVNKVPVGSVTAPTLNSGLTYTGQPQALLAAGGSAQDGTVVYSLTENGTYTPAVPTGTNAGEYEVWYKVQGDGNHLDTAAQSLGTVTVARKDVTVTGTKVQASRTYDGTNTAVITSPGTVQGNVDGENLTVLPGTATFDDKNAGTGKTVTFSGFTLGGSAKDNYNLTAQPGNTTADITPLGITAQVTPQDKDYDGTDTAAADVQLQGVLPGDSLTLQTGTVRFAGKAAGKHKLIFTGFTLEGTDKGNYSLTIPETSGTIRATNDYLDLTGTGLENSGSITLEGRAYPIVEEDGKYYVDLTGITGTYVTAYGYANAGSQDIHTQYPDSMTVHRLDRTNADGKGAKLERIQELDNLLLYEGCSIRLTGNKGIRMITSIDEQTKKSLINGSLAGFTLEEYGTVVMRGVGEPTLTNSSNYAYSKTNRKDPVFARSGGRIQYTNVLVNFQPADYNTELTLRPYIILQDGEGNEITLYGGCVTRTIHYIAQQNMNLGIYKPGSAGYRYLENILNGK